MRRLKRPKEFSKRLAGWAVAVATLTAAASYVLAFLDKPPAGDITTTIYR